MPSPDAAFEVVRKGYDQAQVEAHLRRLDADVRILTTDRDAALDQAAQLNRELDDSRARADRLRAQVRTLVSPQQSVQGMSERMRSMLRLAEDEVAEMLARAETEVNRRVREAEQKAEQIVADAQNEVATVRLAVRADAETAERQRAELRAALEADRLASAQAIAEADAAAEHERTRLRTEQESELRAAAEKLAAATAEAEQARAQAWSESEARRALVEEDFFIAMDQRRKEALTALVAEQESTRRITAEMRASAAAEARSLVEDARRTAAQIVADAQRRVAELVALRGRLAEQLDGTRAVLASTVGDLGRPVEGEITTPAAVTPDAGLPQSDPQPVAELPPLRQRRSATPSRHRPPTPPPATATVTVRAPPRAAPPRPRTPCAPRRRPAAPRARPAADAAARSRHSVAPAARPAPAPGRPARRVPVPAVLHRAELGRGPRHHVRGAGRDLLVAARAAVPLRRRRAGHVAHQPLAVGAALGPGERRRPQRHVFRALQPARPSSHGRCNAAQRAA